MTELEAQRGWHKSSYSSQNTSCVEACHGTWGAKVRDTKNRAGGTLEFGSAQWETFIAQVSARA